MRPIEDSAFLWSQNEMNKEMDVPKFVDLTTVANERATEFSVISPSSCGEHFTTRNFSRRICIEDGHINDQTLLMKKSTTNAEMGISTRQNQNKGLLNHG
jgi:hypothetical protein